MIYILCIAIAGRTVARTIGWYNIYLKVDWFLDIVPHLNLRVTIHVADGHPQSSMASSGTARLAPYAMLRRFCRGGLTPIYQWETLHYSGLKNMPEQPTPTPAPPLKVRYWKLSRSGKENQQGTRRSECYYDPLENSTLARKSLPRPPKALRNWYMEKKSNPSAPRCNGKAKTPNRSTTNR